MKKINIILFLLLATCAINAQSVAINTDGSTANTSSILDVKSTTKGVLIPRMKKDEKNAIATPARGLLIYQNEPDSIGFHYYNGTQWVWLQNSTEAWSVNGNDNVTATNFLGSINNSALKFRVFNQAAGIVDSTTADVALGFGALKTAHSGPGFYANNALGFGAGQNLNSGYGNVAIGRHALSTTGASIQNVAIGDSAMGNAIRSQGVIGIGYQALKNYNGLNVNTYNVAVGYLSQSATTAAAAPYSYYNTSIGGYAMADNVSGNSNIGIGVSALRFNTASHRNVAIGYNAGAYQLGNSSLEGNNTFLGHQAGEGVATLSTGWGNTGVGYQSLIRHTTGAANTAMGSYSMQSNATGGQNIAVGDNALGSNISGNYNVALGAGCLDGQATHQSNNIGVGFWAGRQNQGYSGVFIGRSAGYFNTNNNIVAIGDSALVINGTGSASVLSGAKNTAVGSKALRNNTTGHGNTALGNAAGFGLTTGSNNVIIGDSAALKLTYSDDNVVVGSEALNANTLLGSSSGGGNVAIGSSALVADVTGYQNTGVGWGAMINHKTGYQNVALGVASLYFDTTGFTNTAIGAFAMPANTKGSRNTSLGYRSLDFNRRGSYNTGLGYSTQVGSALSDSVNRATAVGYAAAAMKNDALVLGDTTNIFVGIGTGYPEQKLHVKATNTFKNAGYFTSSSNTSHTADGATIYANNTYAGNTDVAAVKGEVTTTNKGYGVGGFFQGGYVGLWANVDNANPGIGTRSTWGVYSTNSQTTTGSNYGVQGFAQNGATNYGVYGSATTGTAYGVYCSGNGGYTGTWTMISDQKFKQDLQPLQSVLPLINKVKTYSYYTKNKEYPYMNFSSLKQFGFLAQDLEKYFPNLVEDGVHPGANKEDPEIKFKSVNYIGMVPVLTAGMQEQQKEIEALKAKNKQLENDIKLIKEKLGMQ
jgi:trimeric autotransporter adhesin